MAGEVLDDGARMHEAPALPPNAVLVYASGREVPMRVSTPAPPEWRIRTAPMFANWFDSPTGYEAPTYRTIVFRRRLNEWRADGVVVYDEYRHE